MSVSVLVVDDELDVADLFRQHFRRELRQGMYMLHFAGSGEEALDKLAAGIKPQLIVILSDINMPDIDGLQLLGEIKQRCSDLPVLMVTAHGDDERRRRAGEFGAAEFVTKPVDFAFLKAQLQQLPGAADWYPFVLPSMGAFVRALTDAFADRATPGKVTGQDLTSLILEGHRILTETPAAGE